MVKILVRYSYSCQGHSGPLLDKPRLYSFCHLVELGTVGPREGSWGDKTCLFNALGQGKDHEVTKHVFFNAIQIHINPLFESVNPWTNNVTSVKLNTCKHPRRIWYLSWLKCCCLCFLFGHIISFFLTKLPPTDTCRNGDQVSTFTML